MEHFIIIYNTVYVRAKFCNNYKILHIRLLLTACDSNK